MTRSWAKHFMPCWGAQGKKDQHGELWGLVNLFKDNLERLETHQIIGEQRAPDEFRIEPVDFSSVERAPVLAPTSFAGIRSIVTNPWGNKPKMYWNVSGCQAMPEAWSLPRCRM